MLIKTVNMALGVLVTLSVGSAALLLAFVILRLVAGAALAVSQLLQP